MTLTYTKYFRLPKTDFLSEPWIQGVWDSFDAIDLALYGQSQTTGATLWANNYNYVVGNLAIDGADATTWLCAQLHTSAVVPTTFAQDRAAHPSYWTAIQLSLRPRGQWLNNTAYHVNDMAFDTVGGRNTYGICVTNHTSNASGIMNDDAVYWAFTYNSMAPGTASTIGYDHTATGMVATNVQTAIDESFSLKAPKASPAFTGTPTAPTVAPSTDSTTKVATTAFVQSVAQSLVSAGIVTNWNGRNGAVTMTLADITSIGGAPIANPAFTGIPVAPTATSGTNTGQLATTAFVQAAVVASTTGVASWNARIGDVVMTIADITGAGGAPVASPAFTGVPLAPTAAPGTNTTQIATTAFTAAGYLPLAGGAIVNNLVVNAAAGSSAALTGQKGGKNRWQIILGDSTAETGSNAGSDFNIIRYADDGTTVLGTPLAVTRQYGDLKASHGIAAAGANPGSQPGNGNALVGFEVDGTSATLYSSAGAGQWNANWNRNSAGTVHTFAQSGGSWSGSISITATTAAYNTSSSSELKEDFKSFNAGSIIDNTEVYDFKWKATGERACGVIAQQAVQVYPQAVTHVTSPDDWWGIDYSKYVPVLLAELKALRARVAALEGNTTV
jgi:hypothetical protein